MGLSALKPLESIVDHQCFLEKDFGENLWGNDKGFKMSEE
jgi:hypothetical protein